METAGKLAPLGFGFMRLPLKDADDPTSIDIDKCCELVDIFMDAGFTYFDSARGYHGCKSEWALRKALVERYPRDSFTIATKLPAWLAKDADEARAMFDTSLEECGIDYFDYYLLHNLGETLTPPFDEYGLWEFCAEKKAEGKIKKFGFSIHDNAEELERVLDAHPEVDFVQLQINYVDWESDIIQSRKCYEVCQERGLPVVIMEPVKGGTLVKLPDSVADILRAAEPGAPLASWALRRLAAERDRRALGHEHAGNGGRERRHHARRRAAHAGRVRGDRRGSGGLGVAARRALHRLPLLREGLPGGRAHQQHHAVAQHL